METFEHNGHIIRIIRGEDRFQRGECYGYTVNNPDGEEIDSCWGFIGYEYAKEAALEAVPSEPALSGGELEDEAHEITLA